MSFSNLPAITRVDLGKIVDVAFGTLASYSKIKAINLPILKDKPSKATFKTAKRFAAKRNR